MGRLLDFIGLIKPRGDADADDQYITLQSNI